MAKLTRLPEIYTADDFAGDWPTCSAPATHGRKWVLARPLSCQLRGPLAWWRRLRVAYRVFTGELDALRWINQPPKDKP